MSRKLPYDQETRKGRAYSIPSSRVMLGVTSGKVILLLVSIILMIPALQGGIGHVWASPGNPGHPKKQDAPNSDNIILVVSKVSCIKCTEICRSLIQRFADEKVKAKVTMVQLIDRWSDTLSIKRPGGLIAEYQYLINGERLPSLDKEPEWNSWYILRKNEEYIESGSILINEDLLRLQLAARSMGKEGRIYHIVEDEVCTLRDSLSPIFLPVFSAHVANDVLVAAEQRALTLRTFDITSGEMLDTLSIKMDRVKGILTKGEWLYAEDNIAPGFYAVMFYNNNSILGLGQVPVAYYRYDSTVMIRRKPFYIKCDISLNSVLEVGGVGELNEVLVQCRLGEASMDGDEVVLEHPLWSIPDTSYNKLYCGLRINLESGKISRYAKLDSIYQILGIGINFNRGFTVRIGGKIYSTQTLSPYIINESNHEKFTKADTLFAEQYRESKTVGPQLKLTTGSTFQRAGRYKPMIATRYLGSIGGLLLEYYLNEIEKQHYLTVYDADTGRPVVTREMKTGYPIRLSNDAFGLIEMENGAYRVYSYSIDSTE